MTDVYCEKNGDRYLIMATGHADGGTACAGISSIMQALDGWCANYGNDYRSKLESGCSMISFSGEKEAEAVYNMALIGLIQISMGYPGTCHVKYKEVV